MKRRGTSSLSALVLLIGISLLGSSSYARYLTTLGPAECCRSHCHHGQATSDADADRCCSTHLSVLPSALGPAGTDLHHALVALVTLVPLASTMPGDRAHGVPSPSVRLRGSPPGSLLAAHTSQLV